MKLQFWPTFFAVPALCVLLALGFWQVERLQWKEALIADMETRLHAAPVPLPAALSEADRYLQVEAKGWFDHAKEVRLHTISPEYGMGEQIITPFITQHGTILVARGFALQGEALPMSEGPAVLTGHLRVPAGGNAFTPPADVEARKIYAFRMDHISQLMGIPEGELAPLYIALEDDGIEIKNDHFEYALTWFGLALTLIGVYIAWHVKAGRSK